MLKNAIKIKRIYDPPQVTDGFRVLVDRLWPRGIKKAEANIDLWLKEVAPSNPLRQWFNHDPEQWPEFKQRYFEELKSKQEWVNSILEKLPISTVTLLYSARNETYNNAVALQEYLSRF